MTGGLTGRVALITGGARGIGRAIGMRLAQDGVAVGIIDMSLDAGLATAGDIGGLGAPTAAAAADITDYAQTKAAVDELVSRLGGPDILVNNAGIDMAGLFLDPILGKEAPDYSYDDEPEFLRVHRYLVGEVGFEIMESTKPDSEVDKFIKKNGEGVFLIALNVDDTRAAAQELEGQNYQMIGEPRPALWDCEWERRR